MFKHLHPQHFQLCAQRSSKAKNACRMHVFQKHRTSRRRDASCKEIWRRWPICTKVIFCAQRLRIYTKRGNKVVPPSTSFLHPLYIREILSCIPFLLLSIESKIDKIRVFMIHLLQIWDLTLKSTCKTMEA